MKNWSKEYVKLTKKFLSLVFYSTWYPFYVKLLRSIDCKRDGLYSFCLGSNIIKKISIHFDASLNNLQHGLYSILYFQDVLVSG